SRAVARRGASPPRRPDAPGPTVRCWRAMSLLLRRALLAAAVVVHLVALYAPRLPSTGAADVPGSDKLGHVAVFAAVALTGMLAHVPARVLVPVLLGHAVVSELVQHALLPNRTGDPADVVADAVGVLLGWGVAWALTRRRREAQRPGGRLSAAGADERG